VEHFIIPQTWVKEQPVMPRPILPSLLVLAGLWLGACASLPAISIPATVVIELPTVDPRIVGTLLPAPSATPASPGTTPTPAPIPVTGGSDGQLMVLYAILAMVGAAVLFGVLGALRRPDQ
jgi:hypothetical protein